MPLGDATAKERGLGGYVARPSLFEALARRAFMLESHHRGPRSELEFLGRALVPGVLRSWKNTQGPGKHVAFPVTASHFMQAGDRGRSPLMVAPGEAEQRGEADAEP